MGDINFDELLIKIDTANDPSAPPWALVLIECFKGVITALKDNYNFNIEINELKSENIGLKNDIKELKRLNDDYEQRNRNDCLLIHGVSESKDEDTYLVVQNILNEKLGIILNKDDIKRSHRIGQVRSQRSTRATTAKHRPIIIKFIHFHKRQNVYKNKRKLKGTGITVTESLTSLRLELYQAATAKFGRNTVWTTEGRILTKINNEILCIKDLDMLESLESL